jgi:hypothetical protein
VCQPTEDSKDFQAEALEEWPIAGRHFHDRDTSASSEPANRDE